MPDRPDPVAVTAQPGPDPRRGALGELVTPARLQQFFNPRSIALVGASENSGWARNVVGSCVRAGFTGPLMPVHPRAKTAFGLPVVPSLRDLPEPADLAYLIVSVPVIEGIFDDMAAAGIKNAVIVAAGYRESGPEGQALERAMVARAVEHGITVLGPNCMGFVNAHAKVAPYGLAMPQVAAGPVGVALQSGALVSWVTNFADAHAIGLSSVVSMGNEAMITTEDMISYLAEDEATKVIGLFLEEINDLAGFARAAHRADQVGKPVVAIKAGASPAGQQAALVHTGSVAGDDKIVDAVLRQLNVIRVEGIEELLTTAAALCYHRWPRGRRMGVVSASGGANDIIADMASAQGIEIPEFVPQTVAGITPLLPPFMTARNPLDVSAFDLANVSAQAGALRTSDHALDVAVNDPNLDFVLFSVQAPAAPPAGEAAVAAAEERMAWLEQRIASSPVPVITVGSTCLNVTGYGRELLARHNINMLGGITDSVRAIGHALRWLENRGRVRLLGQPAGGTRAVTASGPWSEAQARELLTSAGVPVVPGELTRSADEAAAAARRIGLPVALKICSAQITHKSDIGGVALGLSSEAEVRAAYEKIRAVGAAVPGAVVDGVLVTAMRPGGVELLAGVTVDPAFGAVLAVGLGGIWVEVLQDASLRALPVDAAEVKRMLTELRGLPLLQGGRGTPPADLDAVAEAITSIGNAATSLGGALNALEVNPLWVSGDQVEALDVLVVTGEQIR
jgi:acyl-CoA synthetase (NDP forming)